VGSSADSGRLLIISFLSRNDSRGAQKPSIVMHVIRRRCESSGTVQKAEVLSSLNRLPSRHLWHCATDDLLLLPSLRHVFHSILSDPWVLRMRYGCLRWSPSTFCCKRERTKEARSVSSTPREISKS
jgi:hypothetical protein